jgi:hypothetical protein
MPKSDRDAIDQEDEIFNYLKQSHISAKNTAQLRKLAASCNPRIAELAVIKKGKPPALPGDSNSLTFPGVCRGRVVHR